MPPSDFCLISSTSHNPNRNDSGSVSMGTLGDGNVLHHHYFTYSQSPICLLKVEARLLMECGWLDLWMWAIYGTCWTNSVAKGTDWKSFRKQTHIKDKRKQCMEGELLLPSCCRLNTRPLLGLPTTAPAPGRNLTRHYYASERNWFAWNLNWDTVYTNSYLVKCTFLE